MKNLIKIIYVNLYIRLALFWEILIIDLDSFSFLATITNKITIRLINLIDIKFQQMRSQKPVKV